MDYIGKIYRPPSEARSLLLQVTLGCSHNECTYCEMYTEKSFRPKAWETIVADLDEAAAMGPVFKRVFLCDGDALILSTPKLLKILEAIEEKLPWVERVGVYGDTRSVGRKSVEELTSLKNAGLGIVYHGMESGDDEVMKRIVKGGTREECIETADKLRAAGILHSVIVLLGIGGTELSAQHASATASILTRMDPPFVGVLTTTVVPGTPLYDQQGRGEFVLPSKFNMLGELKTMLEQSVFSDCRFSTNHASNYLPMRADFPREQPHMLALLSQVIEKGDEDLLKPEHLRGL